MSQKTEDRLLTIARAATSNATRDGSIPFGAPVSRPQVMGVEAKLKGKQVVKFLACTEKQLRSFSRAEISHAQLPTKTQQRLQELNATYAKPWARKSATIAYALHTERKRNSRKRTPKPAPDSE